MSSHPNDLFVHKPWSKDIEKILYTRDLMEGRILNFNFLVPM
jgi:hypothetical protein